MEIVEFIDTGWILSKDAFLIYSDCMGKANYERYCELINIYLKDETCKVYGCLCENKFLGVMTLRLNGKYGEIMGIAVDKANRGKGIGSFLIDEVFKSES